MVSLHTSMMNSLNQSDMYYDQSSRSPGTHRHAQQMLHRQPSRHFDAYGSMPSNGGYAPDDQSMRYETNRFDRMNGPIQGNGYSYDMAQAQTWNPNAFSNNNNFSAYGATGRMKSQTRGRSVLPSVRTAYPPVSALSLT